MKKAVINADGASLGNPGPAGIGVVIKVNGKTTEISRHIGIATNNIAEYSAFIAGLEEASRQGAEEVDVLLDSELAVKQMRGEYKVKNEGLKPLFRKARSLAHSFKKFSIRHVPREENKRADKLSKDGAKGTGATSVSASEGGASKPAKKMSSQITRKEKGSASGQGSLF